MGHSATASTVAAYFSPRGGYFGCRSIHRNIQFPLRSDSDIADSGRLHQCFVHVVTLFRRAMFVNPQDGIS